MALKDIQFFGKADRKGHDPKGEIVNEYPAWYHEVKFEEIENEVADMENKLNRNIVPANMLPEYKALLAKKKEIYERVLESGLRLRDKDKDEVFAKYKELGSKIQDSMFTRSEMLKGLANPHEEAKRMTERGINIGGMVEMARNMGIKMRKGQTTVNRNEATRMWKILGKAIGENTNVEYLRRDRKTGTYQMDRTLEEMERG